MYTGELASQLSHKWFKPLIFNTKFNQLNLVPCVHKIWSWLFILIWYLFFHSIENVELANSWCHVKPQINLTHGRGLQLSSIFKIQWLKFTQKIMDGWDGITQQMLVSLVSRACVKKEKAWNAPPRAWVGESCAMYAQDLILTVYSDLYFFI